MAKSKTLTEKAALTILARPLPALTRAADPCATYTEKVKPGLEAAKVILKFIPVWGPQIVGYIQLAQGIIESICKSR